MVRVMIKFDLINKFEVNVCSEKNNDFTLFQTLNINYNTWNFYYIAVAICQHFENFLHFSIYPCWEFLNTSRSQPRHVCVLTRLRHCNMDLECKPWVWTFLSKTLDQEILRDWPRPVLGLTIFYPIETSMPA